jgi:ABC-type branched-subunit amino acid transport system substrate-binding protein
MSMETVKVGVLFSQSGAMAVSENAHLQGILLACEEINSTGGAGGRMIEPVILDPAGSDQRYAQLATELLLQHRVDAIFGCCLSTSRKAVLPVIERFNGILFYPSVYEGFEYSPNVIYGGAVPNQVIVPLLEYVFENHGKNIALIGSDTLYAREINRIVMEFAVDSGGRVVGPRYFEFGTQPGEFAPFLQSVKDQGVSAIISTTVGDESVRLYDCHSQFDGAGLPPIASLTTTESELARMPAAARKGHLSVLPYFGALDHPANGKFRAAFAERFGAQSCPGVYSEVCYTQMHIYAQAVARLGTTDSQAVLAALPEIVFKSPSGDTMLDADTNHFLLRPLVGLSREDGEFDVVWRGPHVVRADPYLVAYDRSIGQRVPV